MTYRFPAFVEVEGGRWVDTGYNALRSYHSGSGHGEYRRDARLMRPIYRFEHYRTRAIRLAHVRPTDGER